MPAYVLKDPEEIAGVIRDQREFRGWSQVELAKQMGKPGSQSQVSRWERREETPTLESLKEVASAFGVSVSETFLDPIEENGRSGLKLVGMLSVEEGAHPVYVPQGSAGPASHQTASSERLRSGIEYAITVLEEVLREINATSTPEGSGDDLTELEKQSAEARSGQGRGGAETA